MTRKVLLSSLVFFGLFLGATARPFAQDDQGPIRVNVNLVQLNVAVTDHNGNYVTGLRPQDFAISEDKIPQKIATFEEGSERTRTVSEDNLPGDGSDTETASDTPQPVSHATPATICIGGLFSLRTPSQVLCVLCRKPARWLSIPIAATFLGLLP
jgi:Ca-activated chloride channel family protein